MQAGAVLDVVEEWQHVFSSVLGRRLVHAADEYYLLAGRALPASSNYEGFAQLENGVGMAAAFREGFFGEGARARHGVRGGFFAAVDGAPPFGYRAPRFRGRGSGSVRDPSVRELPPGGVTIITGEYGALVLAPLLAEAGLDEVGLLTVRNEFFGGNIAVTGLLAGADVAAALEQAPAAGRLLLADVCLSNGRFLDGLAVAELPRHVEVVATDGAALRRAIAGTGPAKRVEIVRRNRPADAANR
jgi:NifB/MoaA-like Fe-S oxidoreductase